MSNVCNKFLSHYMCDDILSIISAYINYPKDYYSIFYTQCVRQLECIFHPFVVRKYIIQIRGKNCHHPIVTDYIFSLMRKQNNINMSDKDLISDEYYCNLYQKIFNKIWMFKMPLREKIATTNFMYEIVSKKTRRWDDITSVYDVVKKKFIMMKTDQINALKFTSLGIQWYKSINELLYFIETFKKYTQIKV